MSAEHTGYQQAKRDTEHRYGCYPLQVRALWPLCVQTEHVRTVPELTLALAFGADFALTAGLAGLALTAFASGFFVDLAMVRISVVMSD